MKNLIKHWLRNPTAQDLAEKQLNEIRRELLNVQRAKEHYAGLESGLKASVARLEHAVQQARSVC